MDRTTKRRARGEKPEAAKVIPFPGRDAAKHERRLGQITIELAALEWERQRLLGELLREHRGSDNEES